MADTARPSLSSALCYRDPKTMLDWLERAFGFERSMVIETPDGGIAHAEMRFGDGIVMVGSEWAENTRSPLSVDRMNTQTVHVHLKEDADAHCERARAAGATIAQEPSTQFYGDRTYRAIDPEGHMWTFGQTVEVLTPEQWDADAPGLKTTMYA